MARTSGRAATGSAEGHAVAALGFFFIVLPCLAVVSFTSFAACRAQQHRAFKVLAYVCLSVGLVCGLTPVAVLMYASTL
ncbi:hypothetical protein [Streptomyces sp. NPDC102283]|uniref:hypothetical protein n=1 Tax=Streptomyces sp. NPDC102283 TaxID=3366155 RepID=UPI0037FAF850